MTKRERKKGCWRGETCVECGREERAMRGHGTRDEGWRCTWRNDVKRDALDSEKRKERERGIFRNTSRGKKGCKEMGECSLRKMWRCWKKEEGLNDGTRDRMNKYRGRKERTEWWTVGMIKWYRRGINERGKKGFRKQEGWVREWGEWGIKEERFSSHCK